MPLSHAKGKLFNSVDYFTTFDKHALNDVDLWIVTVMSGIANGLVRGAIRDGAYILFSWRLLAMTAVEPTSLWLSYLVFTGISCTLIFATSLLVMVEPLTSGTGVPDVASALNGLRTPRFFKLKTVCIKFVATLLSSASGFIWVGPEASMSHLGGATNLLVAKSYSILFKKGKLCDKERLDLIGSGVAMGFSSAFRVTLAGMVYLSEGLAPLWRTCFFWQTFCGTIFAVYLAKLIDENFICSATISVFCARAAGFAQFPFPDYSDVSNLTFLAVLVTSVCCSLSGGIQSAACNFVAPLMIASFPVTARARRVVLSVGSMIIVTLLIMGLVISSPCIANGVGMDYELLSFGSYLCPSGHHNPMSLLLAYHHEEAMVYLYQRGLFIPYWILILTYLVMFLLASLAMFVPIPVGFIMTEIISGSILGRFFGQAICDAPEVVALCGGASALAAYLKFPVTSTVLLLQITGAPRLVVPIIFAVIVTTVVAYPFPSILEVIIKNKGIPFLPFLNPKLVDRMQGRLISEFMKTSVVTFTEEERTERIKDVLSSCDHNGFPVVSSVGFVTFLLTRKDLEGMDLTRETIDLSSLDPSHLAFIVEGDDSFLRCYRLFRHSGLRHMVVVDPRTKGLVGIVTRQDLVDALSRVT